METRQQRAVRSFRQCQLAPALVVFCAFLSTSIAALAQLAITEVMSQASTNRVKVFVEPKSDFWELTNFGTNTLSLDGYTFSDRDSDPSVRVPEPFRNTLIGPGESIILLRTDTITNRQDFVNWWGALNLPVNLQVKSYPKKPGFDAELDAVQLFDPQGRLVDRVDFGRAVRGHTFVYDASSGEFGEFSVEGSYFAVEAVLADDVGSPGRTTGPVPLSILDEPISLTQDAGLDAEFSVRVIGLPRATYQWFFNTGAIFGARKQTLVLSNIQPNQAGAYTVRISNGITAVTSAPAILFVNTNPSPAAILAGPSDSTIFQGQTATFSVKARGYPPPTYQWQTNGVNVPGATASQITIANAALPMNGRLYTVRVQNAHGTDSASARLYVTLPPKLAISEVMASAAGDTASGHTDWFELTNLDTNAVDLFGYRFSDRYSFELTFRITNSLVVRPGESVIFTERLTREEFIDWWGKERLPPNVQVTTYYGLGLSSEGDVINFWNSAETDPYSPVTSAGFLRSTPGVSLRFIPPDYYFVENSVLAQNGTFIAENQGDVGSPGYLTNPPPRFVRTTMDPAGARLRCRVTQGKSYSLQGKTQITEPTWANVRTFAATNFVMTLTEPASGFSRFYLLKELP